MGGIVMKKICDMYPNTYELQVIKRKRKPTLKILTQEKKKLLLSQEPMVHSTQGRVCCSILVVFVRPFSDKEYTLECEKGLR